MAVGVRLKNLMLRWYRRYRHFTVIRNLIWEIKRFIPKNEPIKRTIVAIVSIALCSLGMTLFYKSGLGSDPVSAFIDGMHTSLNISYGLALNIFNAVMLILVVLFARKFLRLGIALSILFSGSFLDLFDYILHLIQPGDPATIAGQFLLLFLGLMALSIGAGAMFCTGLGVAPRDAILFTISIKTHRSYSFLRFLSDASFLLLAHFMGGKIGIGTITSLVVAGLIVDTSICIFKRTVFYHADSH